MSNTKVVEAIQPVQTHLASLAFFVIKGIEHVNALTIHMNGNGIVRGR